MDYTKVSIRLSDKNAIDILEAELAEIGFESFTSEGPDLKAYIPSDQYSESESQNILEAYSELIESHTTSSIEHTNWNAVWESSYDPVWVDERIFIHAPFHTPSPDAELNIELEPNMSFGTGHHPTTHMMLRAMRELPLEGKKVVDFGAGSGILAIYAGHRGAHGIGIEIDTNAADAARANLEKNGTHSFEMITGDLAALVDERFDLILANINRNVIEESLPTFRQRLTPQGWLLCAGFLNEDAEGLKNALRAQGLEVKTELSQDGWTMLATQLTL